VIIPTYNEAENLPKLFSALFCLPLDGIKVLVVDDNSQDGTGRLADQLALQFPGRVSVIHRAGKQGLRTAYLEGFDLALKEGAQAIGQMDADFSHNPEKLVEMAAALENADVVLGSRYVSGGSLDENWPLWRKFLSSFGNLYSRTILNISLQDITTGFRLWRRETLLGMPLERIRSNGYIFLVEMAYMAYVLEYKFAQVPIHFSERQHGISKMSLRIQLEAAMRVWEVGILYADLRKQGKLARRGS
jgi:dolichol-phosphate mannosyltransferase